MIVRHPSGATFRTTGAGIGMEDFWMAVPVMLTRAGYRAMPHVRARLVRRAGCVILARRG
jgi:hypothetical protein